MSYMPGQNYQFRYMLALALVLHGLLIFGITVGGATRASVPYDNTMEVVISVQPSIDAPEESDFRAAHNQVASGSSENQEELTTDQQAILPADEVNQTSPLLLASAQRRMDDDNPYRIITTTSDTQWQITLQKYRTEEYTEADYRFENQSLADLSLAIASLEARLAESLQPESRKPRTLRVTSTSALASDNADYVRRWRDRVEDIGNLYYPQSARDKKLYGDVRLLVTILGSGIVEKIRILSSSGEKILDKAAMESIQLASPFEPFPPSLAAQYDRIEVIRTWQFRKDRLTARAH